MNLIYQLLIINMSLPQSRLRRQLTIFSTSLPSYYGKIWLDRDHQSNFDLISINNGLRKGKFKHPRAKQMAMASRNGYTFTPDEAFYPEEWLNNLSIYHISLFKYFNKLPTIHEE